MITVTFELHQMTWWFSFFFSLLLLFLFSFPPPLHSPFCLHFSTQYLISDSQFGLSFHLSAAWSGARVHTVSPKACSPSHFLGLSPHVKSHAP